MDRPQAQGPIVYASSMNGQVVSMSAIRGGMLQNWDVRLTIILLASFLMHGGVIVFLQSRPIPKKEMVKLEAIPERFARFIIDKPIKKAAPQAKTKEIQKKAKTEETKTLEQKAQAEKKAKEVRIQKARKAVAQRATRVEKKLRNTGVMSILTGLGSTARGPSYVDVLGKQGRIRAGTDLDAQLAGLTGLTAGQSTLEQPVVRSRDRDAASQKADISSLIAGLQEAKAGALVKRGSIQYKPPEIVGDASSSSKRANQAIMQVVNRHKASIKISYERQLKKNPTLAGKLTVKFTIEEDGSVSEVEVIEDTMNNPELNRDIVRKIKRWRFEALGEGSGSTSVTFPFVFQPT